MLRRVLIPSFCTVLSLPYRIIVGFGTGRDCYFRSFLIKTVRKRSLFSLFPPGFSGFATFRPFLSVLHFLLGYVPFTLLTLVLTGLGILPFSSFRSFLLISARFDGNNLPSSSLFYRGFFTFRHFLTVSHFPSVSSLSVRF